MIRELVFLAAAETELGEARLWYEDHQEGLGEAFIQSINATFDAIARYPQRYPVVSPNVRRVVVRRFPYAVYFEAEESRIVVLAVFHSKRDPRRWQRRV